MDTMTAAEAKQKFGQLMEKAQRGPVAITRHGKPSAYLISSEDYEEEQRQREFYLRRAIAKGLDDVEAGRVHTAQEVREEMDAHFAGLGSSKP